MLTKLLIKNIALIDRADVEFGPRLNVLSGETGSGKSVMLDSINFVLGAKADKSMIRYGEEECSVQAVFAVDKDAAALAALRELDIDADEEIIISRKFRRDGRGDIRLNGNAVNATMLRKVTSLLVDVHGQSEHFYLLNEANQLKLIDKAAGEEAEKLKNRLGDLLDENRTLRAKRKALGGDEAERGRRLDILRFQLDEIDRAELKDGEEEQLKERKNFFANIEKILRGLAEAREFLQGDNAALDCLNSAKRSLGEIASVGKDYAELADRLEALSIEADDLGETVSSLCEDVNFDENEAEEVENRLDLIRSLKKKYGESVADILAFRDKVAEEYELLSNCDEESARLSAQTEKNLAEIYKTCRKLSDLRKSVAERFCKEVCAELRTLHIKSAQFCAQFDAFSAEDAARATQNGLDTMRFLFSANAGEPLKPLNKVISGGEMSRLMLAIKTRSADPGGISTYIFDEIDAGIGGNTAKTVAQKFCDISARKQIIAVSHLAQIAAMADDNFLISKHETADGNTVTEITHLTEGQREAELVRLLGGTAGSEAARTLAAELSDECAAYKTEK